MHQPSRDRIFQRSLASHCGLLTSLVLCSWLQANEPSSIWNQFRGANASGVVATNNQLPETWSSDTNVAWKTDLPGRGWSSPVVVGKRVFLTTVISDGETEPAKKGLYFGGNRPKPPESNHQWWVYCLDLESGDVIWKKMVHEGLPKTAIHIKSSYASETPVTDGEHLYVLFGGMGVFCFDLAGDQIWDRPIKPRSTRYGWGYAASPVLHENRLYIVNDNEDDSFLLALDKATGQQIWRTPREEKSNWATPFIWRNKQRTEIVTPGTGRIRSYDLDGNELWSIEGMSSITIATPYVHNDLLIVSSGYVGDQTRPLYAIRPGASGDVSLMDDSTSNEFIAWSQPKGAPYNPTTIGYEGIVYVLYDFGFFAAYDANDGTEVIKKRRIGKSGFTSSPWAYNGKIFCLNEDGETLVFKAGTEFEQLETNSLGEDDMAMATPAIVGDRLLIRTTKRLYCIKRQ